MYFGNGAVTVMTVVWYGTVTRGVARYGGCKAGAGR